jgi:hypothetical protein
MPRSYLVTATLIVSLVLDGCQTLTRMPREDLNAIGGAGVIHVVHAKGPKMYVEGLGHFVPSHFVGGVVGLAIARSQAAKQGEKLVQELELRDPVVLVRDHFLEVLKDRLAIRTVEVT